MSIQRPTCHESWFRVRDLRVSLRSGVQIRKQHFRGRPWRIIQDPASQDYFRLSEPGYRFIGLLDGSRTIQEAWTIVSQQLGDEAPTQGEAIRLLGQLWSSNLIIGDLAPDVQAMLRRSRTRREREIKGKLASLLSLRMPLYDPDRLLNSIARPLGWLFSPVGLALWLVLVASGLWQMTGRWDQIARSAQGALAPENLPWLYATFVGLKLLHELGHGLACKVFGRRERTGGEVHAVGIMLLVLLPVPYIDATSAWGLRGKWQRITVGAAGMMSELLAASLAAWVWTRAGEGTALSIVAANAILIAGVSTLIFNANPLLRYDGYYILSDLLEIPNLQQRSRDLVHNLVKLRIWGVRSARGAIETSASRFSERALLVTFWVLSTVYRVLITLAIILFVAGQLFFIGVALAVMALLAWFVFPVVKFANYVASSPELARVRWRACATSLSAIALILGGVALLPAPNRIRSLGFVDAPRSTVVRMGESGFIDHVAPDGRAVETWAVLVRASSDPLRAEAAQWQALLARFEAELRKARSEDPARAAIVRDQRAAARNEVEQLERRIADLTVHADRAGTWQAQPRFLIPGAFVERGQELGAIVDPSALIARFEINQDAAAQLLGREGQPVLLRPATGSPQELTGSIQRVVEAGNRRDSESGEPPAERTFEMIVALEPGPDADPPPGVPLVCRIELEPEPVGIQALRSLRRTLQERFGL